MAVSITASPAETPYPAGQFLVFTLYDSATIPDKYIVEVMTSTSTTSQGSVFAKFYLEPNSEDRAHFDISSLAKSKLEFPKTVEGGNVIHSHFDATNKYSVIDQSCVLKMTVRAGRYNNGTETLNQDSESTYVLNGVEQLSKGYLPDFEAYLPAGVQYYAWLTDRLLDAPTGFNPKYRLSFDDEATACMLLPDNLTSRTGPTIMRLVAYKTGYSTQQIDIDISAAASTTVKDNFLVWNISPSRLDDYGVTNVDSVYAYAFAPRDTGNRGQAVQVEIYERPCKHDATQLAWVNSRGGWDYLRFDSRTPKNIAVTGKQYRKTVGTWGGASFDISDNGRQYDIFAKTGKESYVLRELFFRAEDRELLRYLMQSPYVEIRLGTGDWQPCVVKSNSISIQPSGSQFYDVSVEVEIANDIRC